MMPSRACACVRVPVAKPALTGRAAPTIWPTIIGTMIITMIATASPVSAFERGHVIAGTALAIDGDTIEVQGVRIRINGIAAPELSEHGGRRSLATMRQAVDGQHVRCSLTGAKTYERHVGTCWTGTTDIAAIMVAAAMARDCQRYSLGRYAALEPPEAAALPLPGYCRSR